MKMNVFIVTNSDHWNVRSVVSLPGLASKQLDKQSSGFFPLAVKEMERNGTSLLNPVGSTVLREREKKKKNPLI